MTQGEDSGSSPKPSSIIKEVTAPAGVNSLSQLSGSKTKEFSNVLANQAINTVLRTKPGTPQDDRQNSAVLGAMLGIAPRDEMEGMLAAQLIGLHNAAMEAMRRAMLPGLKLELYREYLNQANKLSRSYAVLLEALGRHRGKGQQKMTIEHVHVHAGGQAVVGNVSSREGGNKEK